LPIARSLCRWTVDNNELSVVPDTTADPRFANHPLVKGRPKFRFYAGYPLHDQNGLTTATLCVFDVKPREFSDDDLQSFRDLGEMAQRELCTRYLNDAQSEFISKLGAARREAMIDPLTRLWNRRGTTVLLKAAFARADDQNKEISLGLIDLDDFKRINDNYGHQIGDDVLRKIARILVSCVRSEDVICRPGGDEFLLIMTDADNNQASQIAQRIRRSISETPVPTRQGTMPMTASVGYAVRAPGENITVDELFKRADEALMKSKSEGRNRVRKAS